MFNLSKLWGSLQNLSPRLSTMSHDYVKLLSLSLLLMMGMVSTGCMSTRDTVRLNQVELGMDKSDIEHLLGAPLFKNANQQGEKWGYRKYVGGITDSEEMYFIVRFDSKDRVIAYQSVKAPERNL